MAGTRGRLRILLGICAVLALTATAPAFAALSYSGSLSTPTQLAGSGIWATNSVLSWIVSQNLDNTWHYSYNLVVPAGGVSHFIVEVSPSFTAANVWNADGPFGGSPAVGSYSSANGNPGAPSLFRGVKFDQTSGTNMTITFDSDRAPVWGDFYAKDGNAGGMGQNVLYNAGFDSPDTDPSNAADSGSIGNHLLVPDTVSSPPPVPEAGTLMLASLGLIPVVGARFRRRAV